MSDATGRESEGNVTEPFVIVPTTMADTQVQNSSQTHGRAGMDLVQTRQVSKVGFDSAYMAPPGQQATAPLGMGLPQQAANFMTAPPAVMAPGRMSLEPGFQHNDVQTQAPMSMPMLATSQMTRPDAGSMGPSPTQQYFGMMQLQPSPDILRRFAQAQAQAQQNALASGIAGNSPNPFNPYGISQQQPLPSMQAPYSPFTPAPPCFGYGYGPQHPGGVPNPFSSPMAGGFFPTPQEYANWYEQKKQEHARASLLQTFTPASRAHTIAPSDGLAQSPDLEPISTKRKRGKRASRAQIAAEDAEVARSNDSVPKSKRGRPSAKKHVEEDAVEASEEDTPAPKSKRSKKGAKGKPVVLKVNPDKLNPDSKAWRVVQMQKLVGQATIPASRYGCEQGLVPMPARMPSMAEIEAAFEEGILRDDVDPLDEENDQEEARAVDIDPTHGGQLISASAEDQGAPVFDGDADKQTTEQGPGRMLAPKPTTPQSALATTIPAQDLTTEGEDEDPSHSYSSSIVADYAELNNHQKFKKFHEFFMSQFEGNRSAVQAFYALCNNFRLKHLTEREYFVGIYKLIYLWGTEELTEHFKGYLPDGWLPDGFDWIHEDAAAFIEENRAIGVDEEESVFQQARGQGTKDRSRAGAGRKKKIPVNGFRAGDGDTVEKDEDEDAPVAEIESIAADDDDNLRTSRHDVGTSQTLAQDSSSSPLTDLPLSEGEDDEDASSDEEFMLDHDDFRGGKKTKKPNKREKGASQKPRASQLYASQVKHVGPVYPTRRAILTRDDRPYICALCGDDHRHPSDVAHHHGGSRKSIMEKGCWAKHGKPGGGAAQWDRHGSCRVGLSDLNYTKVKDGFVILDQASWDKVEAAVEVGRKYKLENGRQGDKGAGKDKKAKSKKARGKEKKTPKALPEAKKAPKATPEVKKAATQKKVVKAGADESK